MTPVYILERETVRYAMAQPTIIAVDIKTGAITVDRRADVYWTNNGNYA